MAQIKCDRPYEFDDNVYVTAQQFEMRFGADAEKFAELQSTLEQPAEVCGVSQQVELLTRLRCDDGSNPYPDGRAALRSRRGSINPGGRCGSLVDIYQVSCPEQSYTVYVDAYICPPRAADHVDRWKRYMADGSAAARQGNHREAEKYFSLARVEALSREPEGPRMAETLDSLGSLYQTEGKYAEAEALFKQALAIRETVLGPEHPDVASTLNNLAEMHYAQGHYAQAEPLHARALAIRETVLGPEHPDVATSLNALGMLHHIQGDYARAEPLFAHALAIREKVLGPEHPAVATSLHNLGVLHHIQGHYAQAEPLYARALAIREQALGPEHPDVTTSLNTLAQMHFLQGDPAQAEPFYARALAIREKVLGPEHPDVATSLNTLAVALHFQGDYARAEPLYARALGIQEKVRGPEHPDVATSLNNLAALHYIQGDYARAEPLYARALGIQEKVRGPEHPDVADGLYSLAQVHDAQAHYAQAEPFYARALAIREKVLGPEHPDVANSLNGLAALHHTQGDYARAEPLYARALAILGERAEHPDVATALTNLAGLYSTQADLARAELLYERALAILEQQLGPDRHDLFASLLGLAGLYVYRGDFDRVSTLCLRASSMLEELEFWRPDHASTLNNFAVHCIEDIELQLHLYRRALAIKEQALGPDHPGVTASLGNLAWTYRAQGDYARSAALYARALAIGERALGPQHPDVASSLSGLAALHEDQRDYAQAEPLLARSLSILEKALGPEHPAVARALGNLAEVHWAQGEYAEAEALFARALEVEERQIALVLPTLPEGQARAFMALMSGSPILSFQHVRPEEDSTTRLALTTILRRKGRILDVVSGSLQALSRQAEPDERSTLEALLSRRTALARLVLRGRGNVPIEEYGKALETLRGEVDALERQIYRRGSVFGAEATPVQIEDVQAQIPARTALVEMVAYKTIDPAPAPGASRVGPAVIAAFVLREEGRPRWVPLGDAEETFELARELGEALQNPTRAPALLRTHSRELYDRLVAPVAPLIEGVDTILLAPDGSLNVIPFGALIDSRGRYLIERYTLTYLTTGRDLLRIASGAASRSPPMLVAAPDYDRSLAPEAAKPVSPQRSRDFGAHHFGPLPGTLKEAAAVEEALGVQALTGAHATEAALKEAKGPRVLHVATHGFFHADQAVDLRDLRRDVRRTVMESGGAAMSPLAAMAVEGENPLLRSGLALAGANRLESGTDDGILTALEMAGLDLWGTQLVVLSACETGLGAASVGEGVYGLRRSLVIAGAESQLASLWKVDDTATEELMRAYYQRLIAGEGRAEAVRHTQLEMLRSIRWKHPYYWASFIPIGAWGPPRGIRPSGGSARRGRARRRAGGMSSRPPDQGVRPFSAMCRRGGPPAGGGAEV